MKKLSMFVAIFIFCIHNAFGGVMGEWEECYTIQKTCPAGLFCTANGKYSVEECKLYDKTWIRDDIQPYFMSPAELVMPGWGRWSDEQLCDVRTSSIDSTCTYYASDYDEVWVSTWFGFYMVKNSDVTYNSSANGIQGVFPCPGTYPSSDAGASSVFQCFRVVRDGEKEYYTTPKDTIPDYDGSYNTDTVNTILANLHSALEEARTATQTLQSILKRSNANIRVHVPVIKNLLNNEQMGQKIITNIEKNDTTEKPSVSISSASIKNKPATSLSTTSGGFDWANLDTANLFSTPVKTKSAVPVKSRAGINTQARTVVNDVKRDISENAANKSRQSVATPKVSRPTSGKNASRGVSSTASRRTE